MPDWCTCHISKAMTLSKTLHRLKMPSVFKKYYFFIYSIFKITANEMPPRSESSEEGPSTSQKDGG